MNMREAVVAALRGDPDLFPKVAGSLREKIEEREGRMLTLVEAAVALEPIIADAVRRRPSKLGALGLKSAHLLASLTEGDAASNKRLASIARNSSVGIVFIDIADFTQFTAERGDKAARELIATIASIVDRAIRPSKGELVKGLGDGFLVAFPSASQAIRGATRIREAARERRRRDPDLDVRLHIAVHAGEPLVEDDDLLGHDVNLTARILDHCKPDEILVSETARELGEKRLRTVDFGKKRILNIRGL
ncbi:MAG: adenylate/guanylate cyclase domain-containing protein, partial [Actinomycetota bacterium]